MSKICSYSAIIASTFMLNACTIGPEYSRPVINIPEAYHLPDSAAAYSGNDTVAVENSWQRFNDPTLARLIQQAMANNYDIQTATLRIEETSAFIDATKSALFPILDANAGGRRAKRTEYGSTPIPGDSVTNTFSAGVNGSYALNFWGRAQRKIEAAKADQIAAQWSGALTRLTISSMVADAYFSLRALDARIVATNSIIDSYQKTVSLTRKRAAGGVASELEVHLAENTLAEAQARIFGLQELRQANESQLGLLLGEMGEKISPDPHYRYPEPVLPPVGVPSELLQQRPDIQVAEYQLVAANANIGAAKAALYPSITLTGGLGNESADLADLVKSGARIWNFGIGLDLPIFDGGLRRAEVKAATIAQKRAVVQYQKIIASAFKDVSDALSQWQLRQQAEPYYETRISAARNALKLAQSRYDNGYSSYLELLESQRSMDAAEMALIQLREQQQKALINLLTALGGEWVAD